MFDALIPRRGSYALHLVSLFADVKTTQADG
jgi:hypothetical protein